ncbi:MAG: Hsp20/alpha crystallin family protein [Firmicutes bacterium]|nr:Hsp20/alpha crystallin family protein [Bacillota bacterium]
MALLRWDATEIDRLRDDMTRMWSRMREDWNLDNTRPRTHMHQIENGYLAEFELPGVNPELVEIDVDEEAVMVRGEFPVCPGEVDRRAGRDFQVVMSWPTEINPDTAAADWRHGLLSITAHKMAGHRRRISLQNQEQ